MKLAFALLITIAALALGFALFGGPQLLSFWPLEGGADFLQRVTPLFLVALFIERALEVFVTAWRAPQERGMKAMRSTELGKITPEETANLLRYKSDTQRIAFTAGIVLGIVVSAMGIRALALFIYPDQIEALTGWQRPLFTAVDVV